MDYDSHVLQQRILKNVNVNMTENMLLQKCDVDNYKNFAGALMLIFDLDPETVYNLSNRDFLWRPEAKSNDYSVNYIQWITQETNERDPVEEILSYLYRKSDPVWGEPYDFDNRELQLRKAHLDKIEKKYGGLKSYFETVSERLWKESSYLEDNYKHIVSIKKTGSVDNPIRID